MSHQKSWGARRAGRSILLALTLAVTAVSSLAQTAIEAVSGALQGGAEVVRIDL